MAGGRNAGHKSRSSLSPLARIDILAPRRRPGFRRWFQVDDDPALRRAVGNRLAQFDLAVSEIIGRDMSEDIRGHHAHQRSPNNLLGKRTLPIAEHDLVLVLLDDKEIAFDAAF